MPKILGIDLGTTNSCMAVIEGGQPKVIENKEGMRTTPSMVAISKNRERLVGVSAKRQAITNPENTIFSVKRLIGRRYDDPVVQEAIKKLPYKIVKAGEGVKVVMGGKEYTPQEISAMILQKLKIDAEEKLGEKIEEAVITCPAYFDDSQRRATKEAGEIAGLKVRRIINEPTAAALAYGFQTKKQGKILVYDLGGGTFDVSVLEISEDTIEVISTSGDTFLGGDDFDKRIMDFIIEEFKKEQGVDLSNDPLALQRIKDAAEKAKIELSTAQETEINQPFITSDASGPKHLMLKLNRAKLESLVEDLVDKTFESVKQALKDAKLDVKDIDEIIMVGGQTRMPLVLKKVEEFFGKKPNIGINPDEVVACGAAVQAGIFQGEVKEVLLLDVIPLTLGIETLGGVATPMIPRNTKIPTSKKEIFTTAADNQTAVEIHIVQGERPMAKDNKSLGRFILDGIPPAPRGVPQIEVSFDIDANGILTVTAKDKATGKEQKVRITGSTGLSKEEIEKMKKEAELHAEEDRKKKELIEARNLADNLIYTAEKTLKDFENKISQTQIQEVKNQIEKLKKVKDQEDIEKIKQETQNLSQILQKIGASVYQKTQPSSQSTSKESKQEGDSKVQETQYEEIKDDEDKKQNQ